MSTDALRGRVARTRLCRRAQHACKRVAMHATKRRQRSTRSWCCIRRSAHRDVRVVADDVSGRGAQRAALAARLHECVLCEATRWRGACRHRLLVTMTFRTRRDSVAVCITPHYVNRRQPRAAGWALRPLGAGQGWPAAGKSRSRAVCGSCPIAMPLVGVGLNGAAVKPRSDRIANGVHTLSS